MSVFEYLQKYYEYRWSPYLKEISLMMWKSLPRGVIKEKVC